MKLDYSLKTPEERLKHVESIIASGEHISKQYLSYMSDYLLFVADKNQTKAEKRKEKSIITKNREVTINRRQISFEEIVSNLENGEDGLYGLIRNDKNQIMDKRDKITAKDIKEIPGMRENLETIAALKKQFDAAQGKNRFLLKQQIISKYQEQYILKASFRGIPVKNTTSSQIKTMAHMDLEETISIDKNGLPHSTALINFFDPVHISFLLTYYSQLKQECFDDLYSDMHYLLLDLEDLVERTFLPDYPILFDLVVWKIDGCTNDEIRHMMDARYGIKHNEQYFSTLWRKRIPKMIVEQAQKDWLVWHYTNEEYGSWKKCGKCGEIKLAHPLFFSKNTSKDNYYSICKECRRKRSLAKEAVNYVRE